MAFYTGPKKKLQKTVCEGDHAQFLQSHNRASIDVQGISTESP